MLIVRPQKVNKMVPRAQLQSLRGGPIQEIIIVFAGRL